MAPGTYSYLLGGDVKAGDLAGGLTGSVTIDSSGIGYITVTAVADNTTDGDENMTITIGGKTSTTVVKVLDTSKTPAPTSQNIALSTTVETQTGGGADDTFNAATASAFNNLDVLNGGDGTDTLSITDSPATAIDFTLPTAATLNSVEVLTLAHKADSGVNADNVTIDASSYSSLRTINVINAGVAAADSSGVAITTKGNVTSVIVNGGSDARDVNNVAITDSATTDTLTTATLTGVEAAATVTSDALTTLNLDNVRGLTTVTAAAATRALTATVAAGSYGGLTDATATTLTVQTSGIVTALGPVSAAAATTVNVTANQAVTLGTGNALTAAKATALNISGAAVATLTGGASLASTAVVKVTGTAGLSAAGGLGAIGSVDASGTTGTVSVGTSTAGAQVAGIGTGVAYTGSTGNDTVTVGATTKAISLGGGTNTLTLLTGTTALGTGGSLDGGTGTADVLGMSAADAATASGGTTFMSKITGFERLSLNTVTTDAVDLANLGNINYVTLASATGVVNSNPTLNNFASGGTVVNNNTTSTGMTINVRNAATSTTDSLTIATTGATANTLGTVATSGVETVNFTTSSTGTNIAHIATLTDTALTSVKISGSAGLNLTQTSTAITSFDASGVTAGAVTWTSGALAGAATISGGAGNDVINATSATKDLSLQGNGGQDTITGGDGNDTITDTSTTTPTGAAFANGNSLNGGAGNDTITGGDGADTIVGGSGNDSITAAGGNDDITTTSGNDTVDAGAGDDLVTVASGNNSILGGGGNDTIISGSGNDNIDAGDGDDTIRLATDDLTTSDTISGGAGANTIELTATGTALDDVDFTRVSNVQTLASSAGIAISATLGLAASNAGIVTVTGNTAADTITFTNAYKNAAATVALGTTANNIDTVDASLDGVALTVTASALALSGAIDVLKGGTGAGDVLRITAEASNTAFDASSITGFETITIVAANTAGVTFTDDKLAVAQTATLNLDASALTSDQAALKVKVNTSAGAITVTGGAGSDVINLTSGSNNNTIAGGSGANTLTGGSGNDTITSGDIGSTIVGGSGDDTITSGAGADTIDAGTGNDTVNAGNGANTIDGGTGNDNITAGTGNDVITGGAGSDTINAGTGADTVAGGAGADSITFGDGGTAGADRLNFASASDSVIVAAATDALAAAGMDTVTGFDFTKGTIGLPGVASTKQIGTYTIANAAMSTLATTLTSDTSFNQLFANTQSDSVILTVTAGTAAGTYLVVDADKNGDYTAADLVVKLVSPVGSLSSTTVVDSNTSTTLAAAGTVFTGTAADDNLSVAALTTLGALDGAGGNNTITAANTADIKGSAITNFTNLTLASGAGITMTAAQHNAFTGTITAPGSETITLSTAGTVTALANVEKYTLPNAFTSFTDNSLDNTVTLGTGANAIVMSGGGTDVIATANSATATTNTITVSAATGTVTVQNVGTNSASTDNITVSGAAAIVFDGTTNNSGNQVTTITMSRALTANDKFLADDTTDTTTLVLNASQGAQFTLLGTNYTALDTISLGLAGGTYNLVTQNASDIATIQNTSGVVLTGPVTLDTSLEVSGVTVDLTVGTVVPTGVATVKISGTAASTIKTGSAADAITLTAVNGAVTTTVATGDGNDTIGMTTATTAIANDNLQIDGGAGSDVLTLVQGVATVSNSGDIKGIERLEVSGASAFTWITANADVSADTTVNFAATTTGSITIDGSLSASKAWAVSILGVTQASTYSIKTDTTGVVNDTVNLTLLANSALQSDDVFALGGGTADTVTVNLNGFNESITWATTSAATGVDRLVVQGTAATATTGVNLTLDKDAIGGGVFELDLRGVTNGATVNVGDVASGTLTIKDSAGNDSISLTTGAAAATVNLAGGGNDTVIVSTAPTAAQTIQGWAVGDVIDLVAAADGSTGVTVTTTPNIAIAGATVVSAATNATTAYVLSGAAMQISGALTETGDAGAVEAAIIAAGLRQATVTNGQFITVVLDNGTDTGIYRVTTNTDVGGTATVMDVAGDLTVVLIATLVGVSNCGSLVAASIV